MTASLAAGSLAQVALFVVVGWFAGDWLLDLASRGARSRATPRGNEDAGEERGAFGWPERSLMTVVGFVVFAVVAMVANIVLGGAVFGTPVGVPLLAAGLIALRRKQCPGPEGVPWSKLGLFALAVITLWSLPTILSGTAARSGDTPWHLGWTEQLLAGEPVPEGPAPDEVAANAYPWGFHALLGALVRLVPGSDVSTALITLQLLLPVLVPLGGACLARRVAPDAGWAAACATASVGGFGWLLARESIFFTSPSNARFGADLVVASPNAVYELFPPPSPRELALVVLTGAGVLIGTGLGERRRSHLVVGGIALGCVGLISVPTLLAGVVWAVVATLWGARGERWRAVTRIAIPSALVFALWAGPVASDMIRFGGFVNITPSLGREWPLWTALGSWGLLVPLALAGALAVRRRREAGVLAAFAVATGALLGLAIVRGELDWSLAGNATTLHQGRFWPVARLLAAAAAGVGLWTGWRRLRGRSRVLATGVAALALGVGAISPALASAALSRAVVRHESGYAYRRGDVDEGSFMRRAAALLGPEDTIVVRGPSPERNALAFYLFSFSGVRLTAFDDPRLEHNDLRIRYRDLAAKWDERVGREGFPAGFEVRPASGGNGGLVTGEFDGITWSLYEIDARTD